MSKPLYQLKAEFFKTLAHAARIRVLELLGEREAWEANQLVAAGKVHPTLSKVYPLAETGQAVLDVHSDAHQGKVGVLCLAPPEGLGVSDHPRRARHEEQINRFRQA